jgi:hypothetical protein
VINVLLTAAFLASATIAVSHVVNRAFIAPRYDCALNLLAFGCQATVAILLGAWPALAVSSAGIACWLVLTRRTVRSLAAWREYGPRRPDGRRSLSSAYDE